MAAGNEAVQILAAETGENFARLNTTARILRETTAVSGGDLYLVTGKGRSAPVSARHVVNLLIAAFFGMPSLGPATVVAYRGLVADGTRGFRTLPDGSRVAIELPGLTPSRAFGDVLDEVVTWLAADRDRTSVRITLFAGTNPDRWAEARFVGERFDATGASHRQECRLRFGEADAPVGARRGPAAAADRVIVFQHELFELGGRLAREHVQQVELGEAKPPRWLQEFLREGIGPVKEDRGSYPPVTKTGAEGIPTPSAPDVRCAANVANPNVREEPRVVQATRPAPVAAARRFPQRGDRGSDHSPAAA